MQDAAYKTLFSHPRMVADLLRGFAAKGWSDALDFKTLEKLPAEFVSDDLRRRHGDTLWRVRLQGSSWLQVVVLLEFQSTADRYMAVRLLAYGSLLYQDLIRRRELGPDGELPPVLPVVLYNGRSRWRAADEVAKLVASVEGRLAQYQMSLRYFVLDERGLGEDDLPKDNLVASLVEFEASRSPEDLARAASRLPGWFRDGDEPERRRSFLRWVSEVAEPSGSVSEEVLGQMEEEPTMLAEWVKEYYEEARLKGIEQGIEQGLERGIERGRAEERALLCRWAERKFGAGTSARLSGLLGRLTAPDQLGEVGDWLLECDTGADLLARAERMVQTSS